MSLASNTAIHQAEPVLTSLLPQPPGFLNVTNPLSPTWIGSYLFGYPKFPVKNVKVANLMQRSIAGRDEDFLLGILSVLLIAVLSEIVQTVLLRTRRSRVARRGFYTAFALDETHHFRNVWSLIRSKERGRSELSFRRVVAWHSLLILVLALSLLAAEVLVVFLTQPITVFSRGTQYNLRAVQPAGTALRTATRIDGFTKKRRCITPSMTNSTQSRQYIINACIVREFERQLDSDSDVATTITVGSWFHEAGSDHVISFTDGTRRGSHCIKTRATIMKGGTGETMGIRFQVKDDNRTYTNYLQTYMMYTALQWNCNQSFEKRSCKQMANEMKRGKPRLVRRSVDLWDMVISTARQNRSVPVTQSAMGVVTKFHVKLRRPFKAIEEALHVFVTSSVIEEVQNDAGLYVDAEGRRQDHIAQLISEQGRVAGVVTLITALCIMLGLLIVLRIYFRPVSLAQIARKFLDERGDEEGLFVGTTFPTLDGGKGANIMSSESSSSTLPYLSQDTI